MMTAVSIFSCTNDYDPGLIENLGMKEQPLRIITKVLTTMNCFVLGSPFKNLITALSRNTAAAATKKSTSQVM